MHHLFAHAAAYHTPDTPSWKHILTEPFIMNLIFVVGAALLGWLLQEKLAATQRVKSLALGAYCLIVALLSLNYDKPLSVVAWTLAIICLITVGYGAINPPQVPKKAPRKKR
jgi:uncharacterized membrane protein